jgi:hypothetical protein
MASFSVINVATKPLDTSNWICKDSKPPALTKEQKEKLGNYEQLIKTTPIQPVPEDTDMDAAIQESVPWTEVKRKNQISATNKTEKQETEPMQLEEKDLTMKKVKVTFAIRVPKDPTTFAPAKLHLEALHEIHKFDESMIVLDHLGKAKVNFESSLSDTQYKDLFNPVEKRIGRSTGWISISHDICLTSKASDAKEKNLSILEKEQNLHVHQPKTWPRALRRNRSPFRSESRLHLER